MQSCVALGGPVNGTAAVQFAKAKSVLGMTTTLDLTPSGVSLVNEISDACVVSIVAKARPPVSGRLTVRPLGAMKRSQTGPTTPVARGTLIPRSPVMPTI